VFIIYDIALLPVFYPVQDREDLEFSVGSGTDSSIQPRIYDHFLAYKTWESINVFLLVVDSSMYIDISPQKADSSSSSIDDGILFGMNAAAQLIALSMRNIQFIPEAGILLETISGLSGSADISRGNDLVITDNYGAYRSAEAGASLGNFFGDS
jgi:hypothetical protein